MDNTLPGCCSFAHGLRVNNGGNKVATPADKNADTDGFIERHRMRWNKDMSSFGKQIGHGLCRCCRSHYRTFRRYKIDPPAFCYGKPGKLFRVIGIDDRANVHFRNFFTLFMINSFCFTCLLASHTLTTWTTYQASLCFSYRL